MIKKLLLSTCAAVAITGSALAADLPSRKAPPVAYAPPVPIFTWTGFYVEINGGGIFRADNNNNNGLVGFGGAALPVFNNNGNNNGGRFLIGGQAGVNYQVSQIVLGIEGDGQAVLGRNNNNNGGVFGNNGNSTSFLGTVRGRVGIAFDRFLVYGTGGVAFGGRSWPNTVAGFNAAGAPVFFTANNNSNNRVGYALGGGVEYAFLENWSLKMEYLYVDLGRTNRTFIDPVSGAGFVYTGRQRENIVRAGLNYRFNWFGAAGGPVVARY